MLSRPGRLALILASMLVAGCSGDAVSEHAAPATSPPPQPAADFSDEFIDGMGPEERAWLARQRQSAGGAGGAVETTELSYAPISTDLVFDVFGGTSGAEVAMAAPQSHRIQFLNGGAARVFIWDGTRYLPSVFTAVESRQGARVCLARTRGWTGGCLTIATDGQRFRCAYLWNNGASGETACRVTPVRAG